MGISRNLKVDLLAGSHGRVDGDDRREECRPFRAIGALPLCL
jgi:hypothetical protein